MKNRKTKIINELINFYCNGDNGQFAEKLGIARTTLSSWKARNTFDPELVFSKCENINAEWLLNGGEGEMLKNKTPVFSGVGSDKNNVLKFSLKTTMDFLQKVVDSFDASDDEEGDRLLREIAAYGHPDSRPENNKDLLGNNSKKGNKHTS